MTLAPGGEKPALADAVARLAGWKRIALAIVAGAGAATAMAPLHLLPALAVSYPALIFLLDGAALRKNPVRSGFFTGWLFGFGYFLVGLYWLAFSFFVEAEQFAWMAPFAVLGMPAFLGLFTGAACAGAIRFWRPGWRRVLVFAVAMMLAEYARGHVLTGLPWNLPGQALAGTAAGAQTAAWWGAYGLSLVALIIFAAPAAFVGARTKGGLVKGGMVMAGACAALFAIGAARLALVNPGDHDEVFVRIVQPNIPQREKNDSDLWWRNVERQIDYSAGPGPSRGRIFVIWPENAAPVINEVPDALAEIGARLPKNAVLAAGAVRRATDDSGVTRYYNSIAFAPQTAAGRVVTGAYDKHHLVPFGEYLPLQGVLRAVGLAQLAPYDEGFTKGAGPQTLDLGGPRFAPLICYEAIFPGRIHPKGERPDWILAVTNDAWFGDTSGPRQHLDQARLRVIESGLPMARAANTGISALIDAAGRYRGRVPLYQAGVIDLALPRAARPTLYARIGDLGFWAMMIFAAAAGLSRTPKQDRPHATFARRD